MTHRSLLCHVEGSMFINPSHVKLLPQGPLVTNSSHWEPREEEIHPSHPVPRINHGSLLCDHHHSRPQIQLQSETNCNPCCTVLSGRPPQRFIGFLGSASQQLAIHSCKLKPHEGMTGSTCHRPFGSNIGEGGMDQKNIKEAVSPSPSPWVSLDHSLWMAGISGKGPFNWKSFY